MRGYASIFNLKIATGRRYGNGIYITVLREYARWAGESHRKNRNAYSFDVC